VTAGRDQPGLGAAALYERITVPALHIGGWYDSFHEGTVRNLVRLTQLHGEGSGQHMLIGPWAHVPWGSIVGGTDFGPAAEFDEDDVALRWYNFLLKGERNEFATEKRVKIFVLGENKWREEEDWPPPDARSTRYFLHSSGKANSLRGNGTLATSPPASEPPDQYVYDPANPVATIGGPLCCDAEHLSPGPRDQRPNEARDDVLIYSTGPLATDTDVTGPVSLELYAKSSAVDTDFTAKLVDVWPSGFAQNLTEGIVRARYRDSQERPELLNPEQVYKFVIDLWATSNVFLKGHTLRLEVSSSNFPRFDRNLNTGETAEFGERHVPANNTVLHDAEHPSALILPIVTKQ